MIVSVMRRTDLWIFGGVVETGWRSIRLKMPSCIMQAIHCHRPYEPHDSKLGKSRITVSYLI